MESLAIGADNFDSRFRCKNPFLGDTQLHWWPIRRKNCISTVSVAADYPHSVPESSNYVAKNGYHPLEELKSGKRVRETKLTGAEIAKTTIELLSISGKKNIQDTTGIGCLIWGADLMDIEQFEKGGETLFIRLASSELGAKKASKTAVIVASVTGTIFLGVIIWLIWRYGQKIKSVGLF